MKQLWQITAQLWYNNFNKMNKFYTKKVTFKEQL